MASGTGTAADPRLYNIATETANAKVNDSMLADEIIVLGLSVTFAYVGTAGGTLSVVFDAALSAGDIISLDAAVLAHQGLTLSPAFRMFESVAIQSTSLQTYQVALSQTPATPLSGGAYRIAWYCEMRVVPSGPLNSQGQARMRFNTDLLGVSVMVSEEWTAFSGWARKAGLPDGATPTLELSFRREPTLGGNDAIEIRELRMSFEKMG